MKPLCVDCDGTLIKEDLLQEDLKKLTMQKPWLLPKVVIWLFLGRSLLKCKLAEIFPLQPKNLTFRDDVLNFLRYRKIQGGKIYLATAASTIHGQSIAAHLGIFDGIFSSDINVNVKGIHKARVLEKNFGHKGFDYVGDSKVDFPVWRACDQAITVGESESFLKQIRRLNPTACFLAERQQR